MHHITDLQCLVGAVVVEVLILILRHAPVELWQGVTPGPQQPQNHLCQLFSLRMRITLIPGTEKLSWYYLWQGAETWLLCMHLPQIKNMNHSLPVFVHSLCRLVLVCHMCGISVYLLGSCWEGNIAPAQKETHITTQQLKQEWLMMNEWGLTVMDGDVSIGVEKKNSQTQNGDHWRCHAFLKTVVWPCRRDLPGKGHGIQPVHRHRLGQCLPS